MLPMSQRWKKERPESYKMFCKKRHRLKKAERPPSPLPPELTPVAKICEHCGAEVCNVAFAAP
jgi:hypothetical protein